MARAAATVRATGRVRCTILSARGFKAMRSQVSNVNLKLLKVFLLVAEHGSFRTAATLAHRSPSAVSAQVRQLEDQLGVALFHRTTRSVRLTEEGAQLLDYARRAVNELTFGLEKIDEAGDLRRGRVALSCSPTIASTRLAGVLAVFERDYPGIHVSVRELTSEALFETIRRQEVDFGIGPVVETREFSFETILTEPIYALAARRFVPDDRSEIPLCVLAGLPLLLLNPATALRALLDERMRRQNLRVSTRFEFRQAQTLISMAEAGIGVAILPRIALPAHPHPETQALRIVDPPMERSVAIVTGRGQALSPASARLIALLRTHLA